MLNGRSVCGGVVWRMLLLVWMDLFVLLVVDASVCARMHK
jgi:hypothetical protein